MNFRYRLLGRYVLAAKVTVQSIIARLGPVRDVIKLLEDDGWVHVRTSGSHHHYKHPTKPNVVTVPYNKLGETLPKGLINNILKASGLKG